MRPVFPVPGQEQGAELRRELGQVALHRTELPVIK